MKLDARYQSYIKKGWPLLAAFFVFWAFDAYWNGSDILDAADRHEGLAAWIQALGVFVAVFLAGQMAAKQTERASAWEKWEILASAAAISKEAADAAQGLASVLLQIDEGDTNVSVDYTRLNTVRTIFEGLDVLAIPGYWEISAVMEARIAFCHLTQSAELVEGAVSMKKAYQNSNIEFSKWRKQAETTEQLCDHAVKRLSLKAKRLTGRDWRKA